MFEAQCPFISVMLIYCMLTAYEGLDVVLFIIGAFAVVISAAS